MQMDGFPGRLADALARRLLSWLHRWVEPGSREWLDALTAESECASNRRALLAPGIANLAAIAGGFAVIIPATYAATHFFHCQLSFGIEPGGCQQHLFAFGSIAIGGAPLGMTIALALRARFAAYAWAVVAVTNTVGFLWYLSSGIADLPRYAATQPAMLMAATLGVALAAIMREPRITARLIAGTISFAIADSLTRVRESYLVVDNVNHYAVLGSAMFATILAGLISRYGSRLSAGGTGTPVERPL
jgi:hypothetical protein